MYLGERHVLTIEALPLVVKALNSLASANEAQGSGVLRTLRRLEDFAKEGCGKVILNLDAVEEPLANKYEEVRNVDAVLVGGVLVVKCQVTSQELLRIKELTRRNSLTNQLISGFDALFSSAAARIRSAVSRYGNPKSN